MLQIRCAWSNASWPHSTVWKCSLASHDNLLVTQMTFWKYTDKSDNEGWYEQIIPKNTRWSNTVYALHLCSVQNRVIKSCEIVTSLTVPFYFLSTAWRHFMLYTQLAQHLKWFEPRQPQITYLSCHSSCHYVWQPNRQQSAFRWWIFLHLCVKY